MNKDNNDRTRALELLKEIDPEVLSYDDWIQVGCALKACGCESKDWADWSRLDPGRYKAGECERKWAGLRGTGIGALHGLLRGLGIQDAGSELGWNDSLVAVGEAMSACEEVFDMALCEASS
jgi:hypothetical protein